MSRLFTFQEKRGKRLQGEALRQRIEAIFQVLRGGMRWCDLPEKYGNHETVYKWWRRQCERGVWQRVLERLADEHGDHEWHMTDGTIIRAQQSAIGSKKGEPVKNDMPVACLLGPPMSS